MLRPLPAGLILGHRGAPFDAPENTLHAFRLALEQGADGIELDVQPSADGVPVVIHDETVDRTTSGRGEVRALTAAELRRLRIRAEQSGAGAGAVEDPAAARIPELAEVAAWARESGAWLNVELKARGAESASLDVLRRAKLLPKTVFSSFDAALVSLLGLLEPSARRFLLVDSLDPDPLTRAASCDAQGVCLEASLATPAVLRSFAAASLPVVVWTVDEPERVADFLRAGVAAVITNRPAAAVAARRAAQNA